MQAPTLLETVELPVELTEAEINAVSGGQTITINSIAFIAADFGGGSARATASDALATGGEYGVAASGLVGFKLTL